MIQMRGVGLLANQFNAEQPLRLVGVGQSSVSVVPHHNTELNEEMPHGFNVIRMAVNAAV